MQLCIISLCNTFSKHHRTTYSTSQKLHLHNHHIHTGIKTNVARVHAASLRMYSPCERCSSANWGRSARNGHCFPAGDVLSRLSAPQCTSEGRQCEPAKCKEYTMSEGRQEFSWQTNKARVCEALETKTLAQEQRRWQLMRCPYLMHRM